MTKLSTLIPAMAQILHTPERSVNVLAMHLRREGLISSGGRGRGGAEMTARDAATLLIGIMGSEQLKDAPEIVRDIGGYQLAQIEDEEDETPITFTPSEYYGLSIQETLIDSTTKIIQHFLENIDLTCGEARTWDILLEIRIIPRRDMSFIKFWSQSSLDEEDEEDEVRKFRARYYNPVFFDENRPKYTAEEAIQKMKLTKHFNLIKEISVTDTTIRNIARALTDRPPAPWLYGEGND